MNIQLGISAGFTSKRWANPEDWVPMIKNRLGIQLVQFSFDQFDPRGNPDSVRKYCERLRNACAKWDVTLHSTFAGLSIYSHNLLFHPLPEGREDGMDWFERALWMTRELGVTATGGPFGGMDVPSFADDAKRNDIERTAEDSLISLLNSAGNLGVSRFYWEQTPVRREGPVSIEETRTFIEKVNSRTDRGAARFELCLDVGHYTSPLTPLTEQDPYVWIERLGADAPIIHLQQTDGRLDRHWPFTEQYRSHGVIEADRVLEALKRSGAKDKVLLIEIGHPFEEDDDKVLADISKSTAYWQEAFQRHGYAE
jgi:D-erythrulose 1-phosphate 3-epimerase